MMPGAVKNTHNSRRRAAKAARWLGAACERLEHRQMLSGYGPLVSVGSFIPYPNGANSAAAVSFDASGNLWGTTGNGGPNGYGTVFEIAKGSSTVNTIAGFNGTNGANPEAGVTFDANGNLWGTTYNGGSGSVGTVFEIAKGSSTITTMASFNTSNGAHPLAGVTFDTSGNLWGTTYNGGAGSYGTVFEIIKGSSTITTVTSFAGSNGSHPMAGATFDASGNLWGTTYNGGTGSAGTVFEITKGSSSIGLFLSFNGTSCANPEAGVTFDPGGNLWGTTYYGGSNYTSALSGYGTVFEIAKGSSTMTIVASLSSSNGTNPQAPVTFDSTGNLWGTTTLGSSNNAGSVFEIPKGQNYVLSDGFNTSSGGHSEAGLTLDSSGKIWGTNFNAGAGAVGTVFQIGNGSFGSFTINSVASFNSNDGALLRAGVTFDSSGNLWGTTRNGGASDVGTVFEIVKGSSTVSTVASFNGTNGQHPDDAVTFDATGNLWGTTYQDGPGGWGTVFEIVKGSSTIVTVASFNSYNGAWPTASVIFDAMGNLWGTTNGNGSTVSPTVYEIAKGSSTINTVTSVGGYASAGVTFDATGNLWGTTAYNGPNSDGTVFEIAKGTSTPTTVASFNTSTGANPYAAGVTFDASGNLWGTTPTGGTYGYGTVFEIPKGGSRITAVVSFNSGSGSSLAPVTFDTSGNLWGTTYNGGSGSIGAVFEIVQGSSTITTVANFKGANGANPYGAITLDASGNIWGTTYYGGAAAAGSIWELPLMPTWLSDPAGNDTWNTASHTLTVIDPTTITTDPGSDQPIIAANGSAAVVTINPSSGLQIHLGGLSLTNGASAIVTSLGAARTATNHRVLVLGQSGAASAPLFTIDATSKLDLADNDLIDHDGSLSSISSLLATGFTSGWKGNGIVSSKADGATIYTFGVGHPASAGTFDSETVGTSDVEFRYTYYGDANLDGHVDGSDYSRIDSGFINQPTGWSNGDFNYDGVINGSDYTLIDNAFNTQGASLAASIATPKTSTTARIKRSQTASFAPNIFSTQTPIALTDSTEQSIELSIQKKDLIDQLSSAW